MDWEAAAKQLYANAAYLSDLVAELDYDSYRFIQAHSSAFVLASAADAIYAALGKEPPEPDSLPDLPRKRSVQ